MQTIAVIDYGMGNLRSVSKAVEHVAPDHRVLVTHDVQLIREADRVVCPGQGAAADCMGALRDAGVVDVLQEVLKDRPFLGICMGLQVLLERSDENGGVACLNVLPGQVVRFDHPLQDSAGNRLKVPHMGWSPVMQTSDHPLWRAIADKSRFYFAHSYFCVPAETDQIMGECDYGNTFAVALARPGLFACQFHPEKSSDTGLQLLRNFVSWDGSL